MLEPESPRARSEERNLPQVSRDSQALSLNPMSSFTPSLVIPIAIMSVIGQILWSTLTLR